LIEVVCDLDFYCIGSASANKRFRPVFAAFRRLGANIARVNGVYWKIQKGRPATKLLLQVGLDGFPSAAPLKEKVNLAEVKANQPL
jgi:hypothetical protein